MPTVQDTDETLQVIDHLDFTPSLPCEFPGCSRDAVKVIRCRMYPSHHNVLCVRCLKRIIRSFRRYSRVRCGRCGAEGRELLDIVEIVDL